MFITTAGGGAIAGALLGGAFGGGGGQQTQNTVREPWAPAQPWLQNQITQGQSLQNFYQNSPFNSAQTQAMGNMADQSAYIRNLIPSLLGQMSQGRFFDRSNMGARPMPFNFGGVQTPGAIPGAMPGAQPGLLGGGGMNPVQSMPSPSVINAPVQQPMNPMMAGKTQADIDNYNPALSGFGV